MPKDENIQNNRPVYNLTCITNYILLRNNYLLTVFFIFDLIYFLYIVQGLVGFAILLISIINNYFLKMFFILK